MSQAITGHPANASAPVRAPARSWSSSVIWVSPLAIFFYAILLPPEVRFEAAGLAFYAHRLALICLLPWVLIRKFERLHPVDLLVLGGGAWMIASFASHYGFLGGIVRGGALAFDVAAAYVVARQSIRNLRDLRTLLVLIAPGIGLAGLLLAFESISHTALVRPMAAQIFGSAQVYQGGTAVGAINFESEIRLGLSRAVGSFPHPILAGCFLATMSGLYVFSHLRGWPFLVGLASGFAAIFSVSSGALLALMMVAALLIYDWLQRVVEFASWRLAIVVGIIVLTLIQVVFPGGIAGLVIRLTLNPATGYFRILIWDFGLQSVLTHPWLGIGFESYERPSWMPETIDNHWLLLAVRHGVLGVILLMGAFVGGIASLGNAARRQQSEFDRQLCVGLAIVLFVIVIIGLTVAYFGSMASWIYALLGMGVSIATATPLRPPMAPLPLGNRRVPFRTRNRDVE